MLSFTVTGTTTRETVVRIRARGSVGGFGRWAAWLRAGEPWCGSPEPEACDPATADVSRSAVAKACQPARVASRRSAQASTIFVDNSLTSRHYSRVSPHLDLRASQCSGAASKLGNIAAGGDYTMRIRAILSLSVRHSSCRGTGLRRAAGPDPRGSEPGQPVRHGARQT